MSRIHSIPPGLFCVPAAIRALTGEPLEAVIVPALNRHASSEHLGDTVAGVNTSRVGRAVLEELGYTIRPYRGDARTGPLRAHLATWARRSRERWPGRTLLLTTQSHCLVALDGVVYDNWMPHGVPGEEHPYAKTTVRWAALVEKREEQRDDIRGHPQP